MTTVVDSRTKVDSNTKRKTRADSIYIPENKRETWDRAKQVAAQMGLSRSELILQLLGGVVALTPKTNAPAFKLKVETVGDSNLERAKRRAILHGFDSYAECGCCWNQSVHGPYCPEHGNRSIDAG